MRCTLSLTLALLCVKCVHGISIDTVPIGNPGNAADMRYSDRYHPNGAGAVGYPFNIGRTEITNAEYATFLNAVATAADPYFLYNPDMAFSTLGGIVRTGFAGSFVYLVKPAALAGSYTYGNKPVTFVSAGDAMRFANWLHNGQPTGPQNANTTEDGAYTLNGAVTNSALVAVTRNAGARWWLPSDDEWYKAAYHDPNSGVYYDYALRGNNVPNNNPPSSDTGNSANFYFTGSATGNSNYPLTNAGAYSLSASSYGTFDQNGNVFEWTDSVFEGSLTVGGYVHGVRGGGWEYSEKYMRASYVERFYPTNGDGGSGFRVASVPEPSTLPLVAIGCVFASIRRRRAASARH
jgi:formylglycine-generating enzyme required for sulfatase activity